MSSFVPTQLQNVWDTYSIVKYDTDDYIFFCHIKTGSSEIWARPLADGSVAVVLFSHSDSTPVTIKATFELVSGPSFGPKNLNFLL